MRVWLINSDEEVPTDGANVRLRRTGLIAEELVSRGHEVLWWNSTFRHLTFKQRKDCDAEVHVRPNYRVRFLRAPGYRNSISLRRLWNNFRLASQFTQQAAALTPPDLIVSSYPLIELSYKAVRYGEQFGLPVVVDLRDMWPDIFLFHAPRWSRPAARLALAPMYRMAHYTCAHAHALTGHTAEFVRWGQRLGGRPPTPRDKGFPHGYPKPALSASRMQQAAEFWRLHGLTEESNTPLICFFGGIGHALDLQTVIDAARKLCQKRDVTFVICGTGSKLNLLRQLASDLPNVVFPGYVGVPEIQWLMKRSTAGLAPWKATPDFEATVSNKVIEYWSAGVPVLTSLSRGVLVDLFAERDCGASYNGDATQLQKIVCDLLDQPKRQQAMSRNALELFDERFAASKVYGEMADHLECLVAGFRKLARAA